MMLPGCIHRGKGTTDCQPRSEHPIIDLKLTFDSTSKPPTPCLQSDYNDTSSSSLSRMYHWIRRNIWLRPITSLQTSKVGSPRYFAQSLLHEIPAPAILSFFPCSTVLKVPPEGIRGIFKFSFGFNFLPQGPLGSTIIRHCCGAFVTFLSVKQSAALWMSQH
jgi:hypothetical protein